MKRIFLALGLAAALVMPAQAQTGSAKTPTALNTETNTSFADNTTGAITPTITRQQLLDMIASGLNVPSLGGDCTSASNILITCTKLNSISPGTAYPLNVGAGLAASGSDVVLSMTSVKNSLGGDVNLNNTSNYFDGPSVAQGTAGTWFASGTVTVTDTGGAATFYCRLWDGTVPGLIATAASGTAGSANTNVLMSLSGLLTSPAGNIRISCRDITATTGKILFNITGSSADSTLSAIRIH